MIQSHKGLEVYELAFEELYQTYDHIIGKLVNMIINHRPWLMTRRER